MRKHFRTCNLSCCKKLGFRESTVIIRMGLSSVDCVSTWLGHALDVDSGCRDVLPNDSGDVRQVTILPIKEFIICRESLSVL